MSQFQKLSQVLAAAAVAMDRCEEAGVEFGFKDSVRGANNDIGALAITHPTRVSIPVGIVEGKKVFIGDKLWHPDYGKVKVTGGDWRYLGIFSESGTDCTRSCNEFSWQEPKQTIMHASAPIGMSCADCTFNQEPCPACYTSWWKNKHPNHHIDGGAYKPTITINGKEVPKPSQIEPAYKCTMVGHATDEDAQAFRDALEGK